MDYTPEFLSEVSAFEDPDLKTMPRISIGKTCECPSCGHIAPIGMDPDGENKKPMRIAMAVNRVEVPTGGKMVWHEFGRAHAVCPLCKTVTATFLPVQSTHNFGVVQD